MLVFSVQSILGRSPRGERGLKFLALAVYMAVRAWGPPPGAGIEIENREQHISLTGLSLPSRGAWIEIPLGSIPPEC